MLWITCGGLILGGMRDTIALCRLHTNQKKGKERKTTDSLSGAKRIQGEGFWRGEERRAGKN
jgi:hypothetical protein